MTKAEIREQQEADRIEAVWRSRSGAMQRAEKVKDLREDRSGACLGLTFAIVWAAWALYRLVANWSNISDRVSGLAFVPLYGGLIWWVYRRKRQCDHRLAELRRQSQ